jgi:hypothetical protein
MTQVSSVTPGPLVLFGQSTFSQIISSCVTGVSTRRPALLPVQLGCRRGVRLAWCMMQTLISVKRLGAAEDEINQSPVQRAFQFLTRGRITPIFQSLTRGRITPKFHSRVNARDCSNTDV